jgi:diguanylate cyclase (GGDEF)-like protein
VSRREAFTAARQALDAGSDPYAHLDRRLATKLGGALFLIGIAYVLIVLPLAPPDRGAAGWIGVAACLSVAIATGVTMIKWPRPMQPDTLLYLTFAGIFVAAVYRWVVGPGAPFHQLLLLACLYGAAVHPARRAFMVLLATTVAGISPALYGDTGPDFVPLVAGHLALCWSTGVLILFWMTRVRATRAEAQEAREQADQLARIDALTGLGNRRALEEALPRAIAAARRSDIPLSVLVADLDDFKSVNDTFGHHAGDEMIRAAVRAFTAAVRVPDPCFRWGGDEFVALLPGADLTVAGEVASRVTASVAASCMRPDSRPVLITVGTAELREVDTGESLIARADSLLLAAKGRRTTAVLPAVSP